MSDHVFARTSAEIDRVLAPDGRLVVVENTTDRPPVASYRVRAIADYREALGFADLRHVHTYVDLGEEISVLAGGRRR
jgi:ubiquinone/menaquinone biosynthesis C-methylase UbiE